jgi:hypothetical protein
LKIVTLKGIEFPLPESISKDMNNRYRECQKIVDFIKYLGYKVDLNLNNVLFPSQKDIQRLFEFTLESITNSDSGVLEYDESISEKKFAQTKLAKQLSNWTKETWLVPELRSDLQEHSNQAILIPLRKTKLEEIKKKISIDLPEKLLILSKNKTEEMNSSTECKILTEQDFSIRGYSGASKKLILNKKKNKIETDKTTNQTFVDLLKKRENFVTMINSNYRENTFINNVNIIQNQNKFIYGGTISNNIIQTHNSKNQNEEENKNSYIRKIDDILVNFEKEKEKLKYEINDLNNKISNIVYSIEDQNKILYLNENKVEELNINVLNLKEQNENIIREIEEKLETFEQIQKISNPTSKEEQNEITNEVSNLEKKYEEMISNWEEYSGQAISRIEELKNSIETKKKEYNFKYEKIGQLKKEIEEISSKITLKQELANFLNEEYQKIPVDVNRNKFVTKISELTGSISKEKNNITIYLNDLKNLEDQISNINETIRKVDNELEDKLFQDVKSGATSKDLYSLFIKIREGYNVIQKNIIDTQISKNRLKEIGNKVDDYQFKLKSYDYNQLKEQVDLLRLENSKNK